VEVIASAPGKVFLAGEYGVLVGGPAAIAAVDLRLVCTLRVCTGAGRLRVTNGGHSASTSLSEEVGELPAAVRFAAIAALAAIRRLGLRGCDVSVETASDLDGESAKRGLGGSAAVAAATIGALYRAAGRPCDASDVTERASLAVEAHRLAQGGGSGADVVAATVGGIVLVGGLEAGRVPEGIAACRGTTEIRFERLELPPPLVLEVAATGRPAASGPRAARFLAQARSQRGAALRAWCEGMRSAVLDLRSACHAGDADAAMAGVDRCGALLERLGPIASIPVMTAELRAAIAAARCCGAVAKASGAGGGDCAIALVAASRRADLRAEWSRIGLQPLPAGIARAGVRVERSSLGEVPRGTG
jgi:phosphomevalonate kinase